jgi:hypothetical protein
MHNLHIDTRPEPVPGNVGQAALSMSFGLERQVQNALNLWLPMKTPAQMPALMALLQSASVDVHAALSSLHYVHFARFLPSRDGSLLWVITAYDGTLQSYIMDFVAVLGDEFTAILQFISDAPRLPVQRYATDFTQYVMSHNLGQIGVWSAYPEITVIDVLRGARRL